jgi:hypothetical protein
MVEQRLGRAYPRGDVEQEPPELRVTPGAAKQVDDRPGLFVAGAGQSKLVRKQADESVGVRNRAAGLVQLCEPGDESSINVRSGSRDASSVVGSVRLPCSVTATEPRLTDFATVCC